MGVQGAPASDDLLLNRDLGWAPAGPDPEKTDRVLLLRNRISRIFYRRRLFDYPLSLSARTIKNLGIFRTLFAGLGYLWAQVFRRRGEHNLEDFFVNRFGRPLYQMFFESYTFKVWGRHPRDISPAWGAQRIKGLSLLSAIRSAFRNIFRRTRAPGVRQDGTETSLIERFLYPKYGPGHLWERVADEIREMGGEILLGHEVRSLGLNQNQIVSVTTLRKGEEVVHSASAVISSMPIKDLVAALPSDSTSSDVKEVASGLPYRDFMTVGLLLDRMNLRNTTKFPSVGNIVPDTWIYIQEPDVQLCRLQIFNNWSPYMASDASKIWVGLEYMCSEGDELWQMSDPDFIRFATQELVSCGMIEADAVCDAVRLRIPKAYPAYFGTYERFVEVRRHLDRIENLYCVGRNGQHRYNNQDHSMLSAMEAVDSLLGKGSRERIWSINAEEEYHEEHSKVTESQGAQSKVTQSEVTQSEVTQSEVTQ